MARWVRGDSFNKRAARVLQSSDISRMERYLKWLGHEHPPAQLGLKPMEGHNGVLWEARAGGQNRMILRLEQDEEGQFFVVIDVGRHDIYAEYNRKRDRKGRAQRR